MNRKYIIIEEQDNSAIILEDAAAGDTVLLESGTLTLKDDLKFGSKFALTDLKAGEAVIRYNEVMGTANQSIAAGAWIHTHNMNAAE